MRFCRLRCSIHIYRSYIRYFRDDSRIKKIKLQNPTKICRFSLHAIELDSDDNLVGIKPDSCQDNYNKYTSAVFVCL